MMHRFSTNIFLSTLLAVSSGFSKAHAEHIKSPGNISSRQVAGEPEKFRWLESEELSVANCGTGTNDPEARSLISKSLKTIISYRREVDKCTDPISQRFRVFLDQHVSSIGIISSINPVSKTSETHLDMVEALNFHKSIHNFLDKKRKALSNQKELFERADSELSSAFNNLQKLCSNPSEDANLATPKEVENFERDLENLSFNSIDGVACKLDLKGSTDEELILRYSEAEVKALGAFLVRLSQTPPTGAEVTDPDRQRGFAHPPVRPIPQSPPTAGHPAGRRQRPSFFDPTKEIKEIDRQIAEIKKRSAQGNKNPMDGITLMALEQAKIEYQMRRGSRIRGRR